MNRQKNRQGGIKEIVCEMERKIALPDLRYYIS